MPLPRTVALPDDAPHALVVDDDSRIRTLLSRFLGENGYRVTAAAHAGEARQRLDAFSFDVVVLDVMMPGEDGLSLAAGLKAVSDVPILLLTARADGADRIAGLEAGADDYLTKPFEPRELLLRLRNLLRRRVAKESRPETIRFGPYTFDLSREELSGAAGPVRLTERERQLLVLFASAADGTVAREALVSGEAGDRAVDVQMNRLRRKIEPDPANPIHLVTVRSVGYRLRFESVP